MNNPIAEYFFAVSSGQVVVGEWIRLLYTWLVELINNGKVIYNPRKADRAIQFIENFCHHHRGRNDLVKLELWEKAIVASIFGILDHNGRRQFTEVFLVVARKNGKSLLASAISAYMAYADGEVGPEIYFVAPKLAQAKIVGSAFWDTVKAEPDLAAITKPRKMDWLITSNNGTVMCLAFNSRTADGFNPSCCVFDEVGAWPAEKGLHMYEVMLSGAGARSTSPRAPLFFACSTAGYEDGGIYDELFTRGTSVLKGGSDELHFLPIFYIIDDVFRWDFIDELQKSNPNLGVSITPEYLLSEATVARNSLSKKTEFIVKYCNVKQNASVAFLDAVDVQAARGDALNIEDFRDCYCTSGIDLAKTTDLSAIVLPIEKNGEIYVFAHFWLPKNRLAEATKRDGLPYALYVQRGFLSLSGDNAVDYRDLENWLKSMVFDNGVLPLQNGYDRYSAQYLVQNLKEAGFHMDDVVQYFNLSPIIDELEAMFKDRRIHIGDNDLLAIHLLNTATRTDWASGRRMPIKIKSTAHIDGTAALLDALTVRQKYWAEIGPQLRNEVSE